MEKIKLLSRRENEVVALLLQGKSNKQIALLLGISERTVEFHLTNIYTRLQVSSRVELILKLGKAAGDLPNDLGKPTVDPGMENVHNGNQTDSHNNWAQFLKKIVPMDEKEFAMKNNILTVLSAVVVMLGIVLIVGGIITGKSGAIVVGLCVAAVASRQLIIGIKEEKWARHL